MKVGVIVVAVTGGKSGCICHGLVKVGVCGGWW